ncbi:MAG: HAMP domain-containing histidine kinase [Gemmatimonadetes bacterium]|nr:HAMP domain-containing histidine kinase [Gemmatimonadota bacterium]
MISRPLPPSAGDVLLATLSPPPHMFSVVGRDLLLAASLALAAVGSVSAVIAYRRWRWAEERLEEQRRLAAMGTAVARILHQVKNPVQTIMLHADLLQDTSVAANPAAHRDSARAVGAEATRMATMLEELSAYAAGAARVINREPLALHVLVREISQVEGRNAALAVECAPLEECIVSADAYYLRQALENLVTNAREAMGSQQDARLTVTLQRQGDSAVIGVIDTGPGIKPEIADSIFQPFVSGKGGGIGLGLVVAREIVEEHGGRIQVRSVAGAGTHFEVVLPLDASGAAR